MLTFGVLFSPPRNLQGESLNSAESNFDSAESNSWFHGLKVKIPQTLKNIYFFHVAMN